MDKISLNNLYKLNKLASRTKDGEFAEFLDKIALDLGQETFGGEPSAQDNPVADLYKLINEFRGQILEMVEAIVEESNIDSNKLLSASGNVNKALDSFVAEIAQIVSSELGLEQNEQSEMVSQLTGPSAVMPEGPSAVMSKKVK